jgi:transposase
MARPSSLFVRPLRHFERNQIQKALKRARDPQYRDRLDAVLLSDQRFSCERIALFLGKHSDTVRLWIRDYLRFGFDGLEVGKSPGRPRTIDRDGESCLRDALAQNPRDLGYRFTRWTLATLAEHLSLNVHVRVSTPVMSKTLCRLGYNYKRPKHSLRHRQNRRKVARVRRERDAALKNPWTLRTVTSSSSKTSANSISIPA